MPSPRNRSSRICYMTLYTAERAPLWACSYGIAELLPNKPLRAVRFLWWPSFPSFGRPAQQSPIQFLCSSGRHCRLMASLQPSSEFPFASSSCIFRHFYPPLPLFLEAWPMHLYSRCHHWPLSALCKMVPRASFIFLQCRFRAIRQGHDSWAGACWTWVKRHYQIRKTLSFCRQYWQKRF